MDSSLSSVTNGTLETIATLSANPRPAGSRADASALALMRANFQESGGFDDEVQVFDFNRYLPSKYSLEVAGRLQACLPALCSISTPKHGINAEFCASENRSGIEGRIVIAPIAEVHESLMVENFAKNGAVGAVIFQTQGPMLVSRVKYPSSSIPCVSVDSKTGLGLLRLSSKKRLRGNLVVRSKLSIARGYNLIATPRRLTPKTLYVAHRDSRLFSPGAIDNATGSSYLCAIGNIMKHPSIVILSTDAEEYGLVGAHDFVKRNRSLRKTMNVINLDSIGRGKLCLVTRSRGGELSRTLNSKIARIGAKVGMPLGRLSIPRGSDSDVFAAHGFDSSWIRAYPSPTATTVEDTIKNIDPMVVRKALRLLNTIAETNL